MNDRNASKFDRDPALASPLDAAISARDRDTLAMVSQALRDRRMRLAFQPAVYAADPSVIGFYEGFIRLLSPNDQVIPARDFMAAAEQSELGREIDCAALRLGLMALQRNPQIRVSVNLSARSVGYQPWITTLRRALREMPKLGRNLILEINEASAMQVPDMLHPFMADMRDHDVAFALGDFGAGATSLRLLHDLRFDIAKIDGTLLHDVDLLPDRQPLVRAAIALAQELGLYVTAEGVETGGEATWLRAAGVGCLQGYLFGPPTVTPDFRAFGNGRTPLASSPP